MSGLNVYVCIMLCFVLWAKKKCYIKFLAQQKINLNLSFDIAANSEVVPYWPQC